MNLHTNYVYIYLYVVRMQIAKTSYTEGVVETEILPFGSARTVKAAEGWRMGPTKIVKNNINPQTLVRLRPTQQPT